MVFSWSATFYRLVRYDSCLKQGQAATQLSREDTLMLFTIAIILFILWALGFFIFPIGGGLIHILLVIALIIIVYRLLTGQKVA